VLQTCITLISKFSDRYNIITHSANQGSEEAGSRCSQRQKESSRLNSIKCAALCLDDPSDPKSPCFRPHCLPHLKKDEKVTHTHTHTRHCFLQLAPHCLEDDPRRISKRSETDPTSAEICRKKKNCLGYAITNRNCSLCYFLV